MGIKIMNKPGMGGGGSAAILAAGVMTTVGSLLSGALIVVFTFFTWQLAMVASAWCFESAWNEVVSMVGLWFTPKLVGMLFAFFRLAVTATNRG